MTAKLKRNLTKVKDPGSALTHFIAMILAMIAAMPLLMKAVRDSGHLHVSALAIFILSMIGLYAASTIYHTLDISPQINQMLRKIDHMMIFILIAGTYTPVCMIVLGDKTGWSLLTLVWGIAIVGILINALWISTTIQRETKLFLGADNEETAELTVPMYDFGDWASRMKAYRKKNHITQQELAQLMGVKHFTLRSWEQKQAKPPYNVWRLHKHLFDDSIKLT